MEHNNTVCEGHFSLAKWELSETKRALLVTIAKSGRARAPSAPSSWISPIISSVFLSSIACAKEKCLDRHSFVNLLWGLETALSCSNSKHMQTHLKFPCIKVIGLQWFTINLSIILSLVGFRDISKDNDLYCQKLLIVKRWGSPLKRECAAFCQFWKILVGKEGQTRNRWQCLTIQWLKCPVSF